MPRPRKSRVCWRTRRAAADFHDYADGGRRDPLIAAGERLTTTDRAVAEELPAHRLLELKTLRRTTISRASYRADTLADFATEHLEQRAETGRRRGAHVAADTGLGECRLPTVGLILKEARRC